MRNQDVARALQDLRRAGQANMSRTLHDRIGPPLCSAGMLLGLLRTEAHRLPPEAREWLGTLRAALEDAMESARLLNYVADPALASRCGLHGALEYLAKGLDFELDTAGGLPEWPAARSEAACGILGDLVMALPGRPLRVEVSGRGLVGRGCGPLHLDRRQRDALRLVATVHQLELMYEVPVTTEIFSLGQAKAG